MYHRPAPKDKILLGGEEEYNKTIELINSFDRFIYETCEKLSIYDSSILEEVGIQCGKTLSNTRDKWSYKIAASGIELSLSCFFNTLSTSFKANLLIVTPEDQLITQLSGGLIVGLHRAMDYVSNQEKEESDIFESNFSFSGNEADSDSIDPYIEGILPSKAQKVVYNEEKGFYNVDFVEFDERPKKVSSLEGESKFINPDGTTYKRTPESMTTYSSFEIARQDMIEKIELFKNVWNEQISKLRDFENGKSLIKSTNN